MIEKQMSDFLFGEIHTTLKQVDPEPAQRISRYLTQLKSVMDATLESSDNSPKRGKKA